MAVDLGRLATNLGRIAAAAGARGVIAVVKGDAYGHGAVEIGQALADKPIRALATGSLDDALAMRRVGVKAPILMLGNVEPENLAPMIAHLLTPSVASHPAAHAVAAAAASGGEPLPVYVKVDAGFGRLGIPLDEAADFIRWVATLPGLRLQGVYTHLPFGNAEGRDWAAARHREFDRLIGGLAATGLNIPVTQAVSSPGLETGLIDRCNTVACGSLLYGLRSLEPGIRSQVENKFVASAIHTRLLGTAGQLLKRGVAACAPYLRGSVSATGTVPLGIAHGYRQPVAGEGAFMLLRGRRVPVLRVCLENTVLDLSGIDAPKEGEEVRALGTDGDDEVQIVDLARWFGITPLATLMSFGGRLKHAYF